MDEGSEECLTVDTCQPIRNQLFFPNEVEEMSIQPLHEREVKPSVLTDLNITT